MIRSGSTGLNDHHEPGLTWWHPSYILGVGNEITGGKAGKVYYMEEAMSIPRSRYIARKNEWRKWRCAPTLSGFPYKNEGERESGLIVALYLRKSTEEKGRKRTLRDRNPQALVILLAGHVISSNGQ